MAIPAMPQNFAIQQGNAQTFLTWDFSAGAMSYSVQRSTDNITYSTLASPTTNYYLDTTVTVGINYYYQVASTNVAGTSSYTNPLNIIPTNTADVSLGQVRLMSKQRADRENSDFVTMTEWNSYINQSYFELYDLLVNSYEDWFLADPYEFTTDGSSSFALPSDFYRLMGVDCSISGGQNAFVTLRKYNFIDRNKYVFPNLTSSFQALYNMRYRVLGNDLKFIPQPSAGQFIRVWYVPKLAQLLQDTDILKGISGWSEYVIVDAAIKALQKEESDVSILMAQKMALKMRIEESAVNRDIGQPDCISDVRNRGGIWGGFGSDEPMAGY